MKKLKEKVLKLIILLTVVSSTLPFFCHDVYADTISNSNVNINYYLESVTEISSGTYLQTYKVDFVFDQSYLGWISTKIVGTYINNNTLPSTTAQFTINKAIYVNGSEASITISFNTPNTISNGALQSLSQSIQNSNVTPLADLSTLDDILNVLTDIQNTLNIDVMNDLDQILIDVGLASSYLETLKRLRQFDIYFESYPYVYYFLNNHASEYENIQSLYYLNYPIFRVVSGDSLTHTPTNSARFYVICMCQRWVTTSTFSTIFTTNYTVENFRLVNAGQLNTYYFELVRPTGNPNLTFEYAYSNYGLFVPIYFNNQINNLTTDFALSFGLSNPILDDLHIIAQGTQSSNSSSSELEDNSSDFDDVAGDVYNLENSFNNGLNSSLQQIDTSFDVGNTFGSKFLLAADWVRVQFNTITASNPFGTILSFSLLLGVALLIIGKVLG